LYLSVTVKRRILTLGLLAITALLAASPAAGKDRAVATLTTTIPLDAAPGQHVRVAWRLASDEDGKQRPFNANGVFVRLVSASGAAPAESFAPDGAHTSGEYEATVVVPAGGIGDVEIGLQGWSSGPAGTQRADLLFPITNDPIKSPRVASPPSDAPSSSGGRSTSVTTIVVGLVLLLVIASALGAAGVIRRRAPRTTATPQP
jgi:hypothetical protein